MSIGNRGSPAIIKWKGKKMSGRLILAVLSTLMEEVALAVIVLWGLPQMGVDIPIPGLIVLMVAWGAFSVMTYRKGSRALERKPVIRLPVIGSQGRVVSRLAPEGLVRIESELWVAKSAGAEIDVGTEVIVEEQDGLKLVVRENSTTDDLGKTE